LFLSQNDSRMLLACSVSDNHLGGRNNGFFGYNFSNEITESITTHYVNGQASEQIVVITKYSYDHQGRLLEEKLKLNDNDFITLKALQYNEIGDVINTYLHSSNSGQNFNQKIENTYNIRGWLRKMNDPDNIGHNLFALDLRYQNPGGAAAINVDPSYNGNITQMRWNSKYDLPRAYGFSYDPLNRLTAAAYGQGNSYSSNAGHFNTTYAYDANGNITNLTRKQDNTLIDILTYTYNGNRLHHVSDQGTTEGYVPYTAGNYQYYPNGNLKDDPSKKIEVSYNHLNLPKLIEFDNSDNIAYAYSASGIKLRKTVTTSKTPTGGVTDYSGPFLYTDNELSCIFTPAGRLIPLHLGDDVLWKYEYNLTDHLGNVRVVFAAHSHGQPEVMQQTTYYPFGMTLQQQNFGGLQNQPNKLLYNSKELQDDELAGSRLDWYDYGARFYDAQLGRFHVHDRFSEKYYDFSPYQYAGNNAINAIDINGDSIWYTRNDNIITMHVTAKIINASSDNINTARAASDIAAGINSSFAGEFTIGEETFQFETNVKIDAVSSMNDVYESDHLFVIADRNSDADVQARGATSMDGGKVMTLASSDFRNDNIISNMLPNNTRTAVHEFGHAAGLSHESASGWRNLMTQGGGGANVTSNQRSTILQRRNSINRGSNSYLGRPYPFIHYYDKRTRSNKVETVGNVGLHVR
jgi:RHS repeat-associated protein